MATKILKIFFAVGFLILSYSAYAQPTFSVQNIKGACEGFPNGSLEVTIISGVNPITVYLFGPPNIVPISTTVGSTVVISSLPGGPGAGRAYTLLVQDNNTSASLPNVLIPEYPISLAMTLDSKSDNTDCLISNGAINVTGSGGSGSLSYSWSEPTLGYTSTSQDISGLLGGNYELTIRDNNTNCSRTFPPIVIANPSPVFFTLSTPSPATVCTGSDLVLTLNGSEPGVTYEVYRNGINPTGIIQTGTGSPLTFTVPFGTFTNGNNFKIHAKSGICEDDMPGVVVANIVALPTITPNSPVDVCSGATSVALTYSATTGSPSQYSLDFNLAAENEGFADVTDQLLPPGAITISVPAGAALGNYTATLSVRNTSTGCPSTPVTVTINVIANPAITLSTFPSVCAGETSGDLVYSGTAGSPNQYTINFDLFAEGKGFADVPATLLSASPINIVVPAGAPPDIYNATITVTNTSTGCSSTTQPFTVTVNTNPAATLSLIPAICQGTSPAILAYSGLVGGADQYSIDFNGIANSAGLADVPATTLPAGQINIVVAASVAANTYAGTVTFINSLTGCTSAALPISLTINASPTITITDLTPEVCLGATTAPLAYTATSGGPTTYSLDYSPAANSDGFIDIVDQPLPAGAIQMAIPGTATAIAPYTAVLTVRNGGTTCVGAGQTVTLTIYDTPAIAITSANPEICHGILTAPLPYTGVSGGANQYSIDFNGIANAAGFADVTNLAIPATAINITINPVTVPDTYFGTLTVRNSTTGCVSATLPISVKINETPTITLDPIPAICQGTNSVNLVYTATTGSPNSYTIDFDGIAEGQNFVDVPATPLGASPIPITVPVGAAPGLYSATVVVTNTSTGCPSAPQTISIRINGNPTITLTNPNPQVCLGATTASLVYTATTNGADEYSLDFDGPANADGFIDVTDLTLPAGAIPIAIPATATATTYNAILTITNAGTGCGSTSIPVSVIINDIPGATLSPIPAICQGTSPAVLIYTAPVGGADQYSIDFNGIANSAGLADVPATTLPAGQINIVVAASVAANTYAGTVTFINSLTGCTSAALPISLTINPSPTITITDLTPEVCLGATSAPLAYTATSGGPTTYSLDYSPAANSDGFIDIVDQPLPAGAIQMVIPATATPIAPYTAVLTVRNGGTTCVGAGQTVTLTIYDTPAIAITNANPEICHGILTAPLPYTGVSGGANQYSIDFNGIANAAGFADVTNLAIPATAINITINPVTVPDTYFGTLTVRNSTTGCVSATLPISVKINETPTITLDPIPAICQGTNSVNLVYTATTGSPNSYTIDFDGIAEGQNFVDVPATPLGASPIPITVPVGAAPGLYSATVVVTNTSTGCPSAPQTISIRINGNPTITLTNPNPQVCLGATTASLVYTATTNGADEYSLDFDGPANADGFIDVTDLTLPAGAIPIAIPATATATTYNAILTITNAGTGCGSTSIPVSVIINDIPGATLSPIPAICQGTSPAVLIYTAPVGGADQYSIDFNGIANSAGLADVPATTLPAGQINIVVAASVAANTYAGTVTFINSLTGCTSAALPISLTINPIPTIAFTDLSLTVCEGAGSVDLQYTAVTGLPTTYSIDFNNAANIAGLADVVDQPLPASPISVAIGGVAAGTYTATVTVSSAAPGCPSVAQSLTIQIDPAASITLVDADVEVCIGAATASLAYSAVGGGADQYALDFDGIAQGQGFADVTTTNLPAGAIPVDVPASAIAGTYNAMLIVSSSTSGCGSAAIPVTVKINPLPTVSTTAIAPVCAGTPSVQLTYTVTGAGTPSTITVDFDAPAQLAGFADITTAVTAAPLTITIPSGVTGGTYSAAVTVTNGTTTCVSAVQNISITVIPLPTATITGPASVCAGTPTQLTVTFTGTAPWSFTYSDGSGTTSPVISTPFNTFSIPISNPTATALYTIESVSDARCTGVDGSSHTLAVNQPPLANLAVSATINPLCSGGSSDVTVTGSQIGVSYQLRNNANDANIGAPVVGTGGVIQLPTGTLTATTSFNVLATAGGCTPVELTNTVTITVSGAINAGISATPDDDPICSGSGTNITIPTSENGVLYQLRNDSNDSNVGTAVAGTGGSISLPTGNLTATTTFNILATNGSCSIELTNKPTVTVGTAPNAALAVAPVLDPLCSGGSTQITVTLSQTGVSYQLRDDATDANIGAPVVGTGGTISLNTGVLTATTVFNVFATAPGCASVELTAKATVNVSGTIDATLPLTAVASPICSGSGTDIELDNSENGVDYQLRDNATNAAVGAVVTGTGGTIVFPTGNLTATTSFNVLANNGACSIQMTDVVTVDVDIAPDPDLTITATLNPLCTNGVSGITIQASELGVSYQLRDDSNDANIGAAVVGTGSDIVISTGILSATTSFNVLATNGVCAPVEMTTVVTITVSGTVNAGLTVGSSSNSICAGTSTFIQVVASETGVTYQLVNLTSSTPVGSPVAGSGATLNIPTGNLTTSATFGVIASNGSCSILLTDNESITVNPAPDLTLAVNAAQALICSNTASAITIANSQVGIQYQLRNDAGDVNIGSPIAGTGSTITISTGLLSATTTFNVFAIAGSCSAELTNKATVSVRLVGDPACGGGPGPSDCTNFSSIQPTIVTQPSCNDRDAGEVSFNISRADGTPTTFRILWTINGNTQTKFTSSTATFNDLSSGLYQYTIIDEGNGKSCGPVDFFLDLKTQVEILEKQVSSNVSCYGGTDGNAILKVDGSTTGEYWYRYVKDGVESTAQTFTPGAPLPGGLPADDNDFIIIKVDDNFNFTCPDTVMVRIKHTYAKIDFAVAATDVTTCNGTDGSINVTGIGGGDSGANPLQARLKKAVPFSTDPSGYIVVSDFADVTGGTKAYANLAQGNYIVDVRDHLDCIQSKPINVQAPGQVPLAVVSITAIDATCDNAGESGAIRVTISEAGNYQVAVSKDALNVPADSEFINYASPSLPNVTFADLSAGVYYLYIKSSTTTCPTRTDAITINGVIALADFEVLSNCGNVNLTINNITGQQSEPFVIRVFSNDDKFFKIDSLAASSIPLSSSVTFAYAPPAHAFLNTPGTYRFVMVQKQTTGAGTCTLVSDTVVYDVRELLGITLGTVKPSFPEPKHTGSIEIANATGGTRFVGSNNDLYYEISLTTADDDIVIKDWEKLKLNTQNRFTHLYDYLPPGVYRVKVRDAAGCIKTLDVEIPLETSLYVPNIFTPNNDGINDEFEILNLPVTGTHQLIITNRWGNEVFKSGDYREGNFWNADNVADGIYYYRLKVDGGEVYNGWVEIVRGAKP
ncbi:gliding motility-associated C-terminal domain-containing protein [Chryseolinea sp. T2]|uniref:T9SS type B sorting domain-containing protein n=1 Tax=Chryseolinea sp. T2 TaxID=3129255 RepID=UPI0030782F91